MLKISKTKYPNQKPATRSENPGIRTEIFEKFSWVLEPIISQIFGSGMGWPFYEFGYLKTRKPFKKW